MGNWRIVLVSAVVCTLSACATAATVYVSPAGNNQWSGSIARPNAQGTDGPVATLDRARDILRQRKPSAPEERRVVIADGRYQLLQPFVLTPDDSGVAYEAAPGASGLLRRQDHPGIHRRARRAVECPDPGSRRRHVVLRSTVRQRPPGHPGANAEQVLRVHGTYRGSADRGAPGNSCVRPAFPPRPSLLCRA